MDILFIIYAIINFLILIVLTFVIIRMRNDISNLNENNLTKELVITKLKYIYEDMNRIDRISETKIPEINQYINDVQTLTQNLLLLIIKCINENDCTFDKFYSIYKADIEITIENSGVKVSSILFYEYITVLRLYYELYTYRKETRFLYNFARRHNFEEDIKSTNNNIQKIFDKYNII